jgi:hypothetical protein
LALPPEWWANAEEDSILVGDRDDVGCIEISTLHKEEEEFDAATVRAIALEDAAPTLQWRPVTLGDFTGLSCDYVDEGVAIHHLQLR